MDLKAFFETFFHELWIERDAGYARAVRADTAGGLGLGHGYVDNARYREFHKLMCDTFPETRMEIVQAFQDGDERIALLLTFHAKTRSGRPIEIRGSAFARVVRDRIVESENLFDVVSLLAQAGIASTTLSPPAGITFEEAVKTIQRAGG